MSAVVLDTSVAVPFLVRSHAAHALCRSHVGTRRPRLAGQSLVETYSVLTRLPGDARVAPADVVRLFEANFDEPALLDLETSARVPHVLAPLGVAGGAVYDALVALAARRAGIPLVTRDRRASSTYGALGAEIDLLAE